MVPHRDDHNLTSIFSALARRNFCNGAREFAGDIGLPFEEIRDASDNALSVLSRLTDVPTEKLAFSAFRRTDGRNFTLGDQLLTPSSLRRHSVVVCRQCLAEDLRDGQFGNELDIYQRSSWEIGNVRACVRHSAKFHKLPIAVRNHLTFDLHAQIAGELRDIADGESEVVTALDYEKYLTDRVAGESSNMAWLDSLPFHC